MTSGEYDDVVSFGDWLQRRRHALDLTQAALAQMVGCAVVTIKKIERDERRPSRQLAVLLAEHLAIPPLAREDFIRMARGQFVPTRIAPDQIIRPPAFLQREGPAGAASPPAFVARARELDWLSRQLALACSGDGRALFVVGEAGSGKTALLAAVARQAQKAHDDLIVAGGHCNAQAGVGDPYLPFRDILGMLTGDLEARWAAGSISRGQLLRLWELFPYAVQAILEWGPHLVDSLVPGPPLLRRMSTDLPERADWLAEMQRLSAQQREQGPPREQGRLLQEVTRVLQALAKRHPLLLLLDDLQWVDDASTDLLFHLGRRLSGSRILLLGAYRPAAVSGGQRDAAINHEAPHPLAVVIGEFKRYFGDIELDLNKQSPAERRAFTEALLDREPNRFDEAFRERFLLQTQGHPLFAVEMLRYMQADGTLIRDEAGLWTENAAAFPQRLPVRVEAVIEQRLSRLNPDLRELLTIASVEGELFTAQVVGRILGKDETQILRRLAHDLERDHHLVRETGEVTVAGETLNQYRFEHVLFQEYLYDRLGQGEQRLYHRQVGEALEAIFAAHTYHVINPILHESDRIADVLARPYPDCLVAFGPALVHHFWHGHAWAKAAGYALCVGAAAMKVYALRDAMGAFARALAALDQMPDPPYTLRFEAILRWQEAAFKFRPYDEQLQQLARAEQIARDESDQRRLIQALHRTANVHLARGMWMRAGPGLMECLALAETLGNERLSVRPLLFKGMMANLSNPSVAVRVLAQVAALAQRYEDHHVEALAWGNKAQAHAQLGQFALARAALQEAQNLLQHTDSPLTASDVDLLSAWTYLAMGDAERALVYGQRSVEKAIATDNMDCICYGFDCVGYSDLELQKIDDAASAFSEAVKRSQASGAIIPQLLGQAGLGMTDFFHGRTAATADMEAALATMHSYHDDVGAAAVDRMLGACLLQTGDLDGAEDHFNAALHFYRELEMRPYLVRTLSDLARLFSAEGRPDKARATQREADTLWAALSDATA